MTYRELVSRLRASGIEDAEYETQCLLGHFCACTASHLRAFPERDYESDALEAALRQRCAREPLQYILGTWEFYRQSYEVSPDCLIPRSDTECLVEEAIRRLPENAVFADLCTGSGCIAVSVLAERPDTRAIAVDKFENTLALAERNAQRNGVSARFVPRLADLLSPRPTLPFAPFDAILCNPPYIATAVIDTLSPEVHAEPRAALDGGEDGLVFYRHILKTQRENLKPGGFFLFEIGFDQKDALLSLAAEQGFRETRVIRDLGGCDRVVYISNT